MAKVGQDIFQSIGIDRHEFCSKCCYNLMTRPLLGRCPECGQSYDARSGSRRGILVPEIIRWPVGDAISMLSSAGVSGFMFYQAHHKVEPWLILWGLPFFVMALLLFRGTWRKTGQALRMRSLQREATK